RIEQVAYRDFAAAEWEFTYIKDGVTRHVLYRSFVASGHTFGLYISAPLSSYDATVAAITRAEQSFTPS
ncbi:MAG: hypothetical protein ACR2JQ_11995, partial [Mycobacteriales bacterium]